MAVYVSRSDTRCPNCSSPLDNVGSHHADGGKKCRNMYGGCGLTFLVGNKPYRDVPSSSTGFGEWDGWTSMY